MIRYVVDASAIGPLIIPDEAGDLIEELPAILASDDALVPVHWWLEVANLIRSAFRRKRLDEALLSKAFDTLQVFDIMADPDTNRFAWTRTMQLATVHSLTAYDAAYLELAKRSGRTLVTLDRALNSAAMREGIEVFQK